MNAERSGIGAAGGEPARPLVEGKRIRLVRPGSGDAEMPQGVFDVDAVSCRTVGSEGIFIKS
jgi:hypothetical protein